MLEWLEELFEQEPDKEWLRPRRSAEHGNFEPQAWHAMYFEAFDALQYDRFYGAMGGEGPIYYSALSQYARDHSIAGDRLKRFHIFMNAIDGEWLKIQRERAEAAEAERKSKEARR
ncbi:phage tail assembly chaperone [Rhizobium sp. N324]|uniref:phage tail assembly chaperone n=1 Tax=Rhizobium sp. N324 TaxID=1703969 RepID=UPI0007EA0B0D|nr:hypothetical protein [Rhizobium sp. N324]ANM12043.1 hypothetical protein AMK05_CH03694 [Rhizobium sp. N324]